MKRGAAILLLAVLLAPMAGAAPPTSILRWRNGESLSGELAGGTAEEAVWRSPLFAEPLRVRWAALRRVESQVAGARNPDAFGVNLRDGSHLYGELVGLSEETLTLRSSRHGEITLQRAAVQSIQRQRGARGLQAGPAGDAGWASRPKGQEQTVTQVSGDVSSAVPELRGGPGGALLFPFGNTSALLAGSVPPLVQVEFRVRGAALPDFQLSLSGAVEAKAESAKSNIKPVRLLRIETWGEDLVLVSDRKFKLIRKLAKEEREISLRLSWDRQTGHCVVSTPGQEELVTWEVPAWEAKGTEGVLLYNKGRQLALEFLRVQEATSEPPPRIDLAQPRVLLLDGHALTGVVQSVREGVAEVQAAGEEQPRSVPLESIEAVVLAPRAPANPLPHGTTLTFADGTYLVGELAGSGDGQTRLKTSFAVIPIPVQLAGLRQWLPESAAPGDAANADLSLLDELAAGETLLHGTWAPGGDGVLRWLPVGGKAPVALPAETACRITRRSAGLQAPPGETLFYTRAGDILAGALRGVGEQEVELTPSWCSLTKLPVAALAAVQFSGTARGGVHGFDDPGWKLTKGDEALLTRTGGELTMQPGCALAHAYALQSSELRFKIRSEDYSALRLSLFCAGPDASKSTRLILMPMGERITIGLESQDGQFNNQTQARIAEGPVSVRLVIQERGVQVFINDVMLQRYPLDAAKRAGSGLLLEPASMWGNNVQSIGLLDFVAESTPGRVFLPEVAEEVRREVTTLPRFRKQDAPRHLLLATNGDVLRGEIEAATSTHFGFRSGLENLRVPRERVQAAIWLQKPAADAPATVAKSSWELLLERPLTRQMSFGNAPLQMYTSMLRNEAPKVSFVVPPELSGRRAALSFSGQTLRELLDDLCVTMKLTYSMRDDGAVVFADNKAGAGLPPGQLMRTYWLPRSPFPEAAGVREKLAGESIAFTGQAAVTWSPALNLLTMTNTPAEHQKLAQWLKKELGAAPYQPTHWLLLANGARLGLAVERFEQDAVVGQHPLYGACRVPMAQVYSVSTTPLETSPTMKTVANWRLVDAPEPVLPEAGGQSSPTLGKEAPAFQLALLEGGNFNLAQEKGKVVVLDFWATWCGPCVKSLPGLIEAIGAFPPEQVKFIGVNQAEPPEQVKRFMAARSWKFSVALDAGQTVGRLFGADGIPHTVIVGADGKVAWVHTGYSPEGAGEVAAAIKKLLAPPPN